MRYQENYSLYSHTSHTSDWHHIHHGVNVSCVCMIMNLNLVINAFIINIGTAVSHWAEARQNKAHSHNSHAPSSCCACSSSSSALFRQTRARCETAPQYFLFHFPVIIIYSGNIVKEVTTPFTINHCRLFRQRWWQLSTSIDFVVKNCTQWRCTRHTQNSERAVTYSTILN